MIKLMPLLEVSAGIRTCTRWKDGHDTCGWHRGLDHGTYCGLFEVALELRGAGMLRFSKRCERCRLAERAALQQACDAGETIQLITESMEKGLVALANAKSSLDESLVAALENQEILE